MARAFLVQEPLRMTPTGPVPRIKYATLRPYGTPEFLFSWGELEEGQPLPEMAQLVWQLRARLSSFSDEDFIVPVGNPALIGMAIAVAAECNGGRVKVLDWRRESNQYRVIDFDLKCKAVA